MTPLDALNEAIKAWRKSKHARFSQIAEWATAKALTEPRPIVGASGKKADVAAWLTLYDKGDVLDVPRLLAAASTCGKSAIAADRLTLLAKRNDPRVVTGIFGILEKPPWSARTAMPFFRTCASLLAASGELGVRERLLDLSTRYKAIITTTVSDDFAAVFRRTAEAMDQVKPGPLPAALEKKAAELEALFDKELATQSRAKASSAKSRQSDGAFLAAIYARPDDDAPRLVFADALTERGDSRGEFISLQLTRAKGHATREGQQRERELCRDAKKKSEWALPLSQGGEAHLARGFPDQLMIDPRSLKTIVGLEALRTVTKVDGFNRSPPLKHTNAFLFHEHAAHLKYVGQFPRDLFDALDGPMNWEEVSLSLAATKTDFDRLPKLKRLRLQQPWGTTMEARAFEGLSRLEAYDHWGPAANDPALWAHLPNLTRLHLGNPLGDDELKAALAQLKKLKSLDLEWVPKPRAFEGAKLEYLRTRYLDGVNVDGLLDAMPTLKTLEVGMNNPSVKELNSVFASASAKKLAQLSELKFSGYHFKAPFTDGGELTLRQWGLFSAESDRVTSVLAALPKGVVKRVLLRPQNDDPTHFAPPPPTPEQLEALRAKLPQLNFEVQWF
ncbi:MAG: TIGR02996 domain-containing protein [Archangium sp.]